MRCGFIHGLVALLCATCHANDWTIQAERWVEADALFRRDSRWLGADAANSIDLGGGRTLWTFGDSFVNVHEDPTQRRRKTAQFIRNSVAIQVGYDPTSAEFHPYWQETDGAPSSFFRSEGEVLLWPGGGLLVDDRLLVFLMRIRNAKTEMGFAVDGWSAVLIDNPQDSPLDWRMKYLATPQNDLGVMVGSGSIVRHEDWVYAFGSKAYPPHRIFLVRFPVDSTLIGDLSKPQWWAGRADGWIPQADWKDVTPQPVVANGQTEFTVHDDANLSTYLFTQFQGFPQSPLGFRTSNDLTGPWSDFNVAFDPIKTENDTKDLMLYAAKSHPEQQCQGVGQDLGQGLGQGLAVTYCTNRWNVGRVREDESVYFPRFVRLVIERDESADE
jgi:hypothetical protein